MAQSVTLDRNPDMDAALGGAPPPSLDDQLTKSGDDLSKTIDEEKALAEEHAKRGTELAEDINKRRLDLAANPPPSLPKQEDVPQPKYRDPMEGFGSNASILAVFGSLLTRRPLLNALNASASVINAQRGQDRQAYDDAIQTWKLNFDKAKQMFDWQKSIYDEIIAKIDTDQKLAQAEFIAYGTALGDKEVVRLAQQGMFTEIVNLKKFEYEKFQQAQNHADTITQQKLDRDERAREADQRAAQLRDAEADRLAAGWQVMVDPGNKDAAGNPTPYSYNTRTGQKMNLEHTAPYEGSGQIQKLPTGAQAALKIPDSTANFFADQALAGDFSGATAFGRNQTARTQIGNAIEERGAARGLNGADIAAIRAQYVGDTQAQRTIGQRTGAIAVSGEEARGVAGLVKDAYAKLPRGDFRPFNQLKSMWGNQTNSPEQGAAYLADFSLATAYARALNPQGVPRESDIGKAEELFNGADSFEKHMAVVNQILKEIDVITSSTGAARISQINRIRQQRGLGEVSPETAPKTNVDDLLEKYK